jgi:hypothetical protein
VPVAHVLLMHAVKRRLLEREGKFDKSGMVCHANPLFSVTFEARALIPATRFLKTP